ncbi:MAG: T9SS type A sorting domain-containing protein, partial [Bacteroidales bacterium]|nr:T9SS type A sorting domain-containing protein [Bacteroidales bacterium]MCF8402287.1 T9SS type A sorting domain-containing protein [Bacteroidales bacterium]
SYIGNSEFAVTDVIINIDEEDMQDFSFTLARAKCSNTPGLINITGDTTWENNNIILDNVTISNNAKLTITSTIGMGASVDMYVGQGSKLIVDGGKLTNACSSLWGGVDVYGDPDYSQSYTEYHGEVQVINGGCIQYAINGIETTQAPPRDGDGYAGGIIKIDSGTIRNNITGIKFNPFQNTKPGTGEPWPNVSYIKNCTFLTDTGLVKLQATPEQHISFLGVSGIPVTACDFYNTTQPQQDPAELGKGILSVDADFFMNGKCVEHDPQTFECTKWQQSRFANLDYGVYAINTHSNRAPTIKRTLFEQNYTGIYLSSTPQVSIYWNDFDIRKTNIQSAQNNQRYGGIYLNDACDGFMVEENYFYNDDENPLSGSDTSIGIVINNSGEVNNELYNNIFENLNYGTLAINCNRGTDVFSGLQIKCNVYDSCEFDVAVTTSLSDSANGIAAYQGSNANFPTAPAGNRFSNIGIHDDSDYSNDCENITYWHHTEQDSTSEHLVPDYHTPIPLVDPSENPNNIFFYKEESCPSNLPNNDTVDIDEEKNMMANYGNEADSVNNLLQNLKDGGDTEALNAEVQTSWPEEAYEVYTELMTNSPYLTDTVMVSSVEKESVLNPVMVTDILSANPQAAKSDSVQQSLDNRTNQLSNDQRAQIDQGLFSIGAMESLQSKLSHYKSQRSRSFYKIIRYYKNDTSSASSKDSLINMLEQENKLRADYTLALEYYDRLDTTNVMMCLNEISSSYNLTVAQQNQHQNYLDYFDILIDITASGRNILQADSTEKAELYTILDNSTGRLNALIRNTLILCDTLTYEEPYVFPGGLKASRVRYLPSNIKTQQNKLKIYPNPAGSYVVISYQLNKTDRNCRILFTDSKGSIAKIISLNNKKDHIVVSLNDLPNGLYLCILYANNQKIDALKLSKVAY